MMIPWYCCCCCYKKNEREKKERKRRRFYLSLVREAADAGSKATAGYEARLRRIGCFQLAKYIPN